MPPSFVGFIVRCHLYEDIVDSVPLKISQHLPNKLVGIVARFTEGAVACLSFVGDNYTYFWRLWTAGNLEVFLEQILLKRLRQTRLWQNA